MFQVEVESMLISYLIMAAIVWFSSILYELFLDDSDTFDWRTVTVGFGISLFWIIAVPAIVLVMVIIYLVDMGVDLKKYLSVKLSQFKQRQNQKKKLLKNINQYNKERGRV